MCQTLLKKLGSVRTALGNMKLCSFLVTVLTTVSVEELSSIQMERLMSSNRENCSPGEQSQFFPEGEYLIQVALAFEEKCNEDSWKTIIVDKVYIGKLIKDLKELGNRLKED